MTDKTILINTLEFLKNKGYQNLSETQWKELDIISQARIKDTLLKNKFIRLAEGQPFTFEITTEGNFAKAKDLYEDGLLIASHPLNALEIKILQRLNRIKGDPNATDEVIQRELGIDLNEVKEAINSLERKKFIYEESDINQKNLGMRAWKIWPSGESQINKIQEKIDLEKNKSFFPKLELGHKIAIVSVVIALLVFLFGNNIIGRFSDNENKIGIGSIETTATNTDRIIDTLNLPYLESVPILDKGLFIKYYFNDLVFGGANIDTVKISTRTKNGEYLEMTNSKNEITMDINAEPYIEIEYKNKFYSFETTGQHHAFNCIITEIIKPTLLLKNL